ncbi:hypothetical protein SAMN05421663_1024 [Terribacillus halophilus]|uniref:DUF4352 domain-containing protein n=1 Tax=Terribacillus halophilus TaxID=361279 RepID=A0A1G6KH71_9BACI|nr:hypothetical protein [Terribacillus halophilus]SDC29915.1 hypothetical protein SAMN05421663_1024 [Terribacillus halophilus]
MKKIWLMVLLLSILLVLGACSHGGAARESAEVEKKPVLINGELERRTGSDVEIMYHNEDPNITFQQGDVTFTVDKYQVSYAPDIIFPADKEGGKIYIVSLQTIVENQSGETAVIRPPFIEHGENIDFHYIDNSYLADESILFPDTLDLSLQNGEKRSGILEYVLTQEELKSMENAHVRYSAPVVTIGDKEETSSFIQDVPLALNEQSEEAVKAQNEMYPDRSIQDGFVTDKELLSQSSIEKKIGDEIQLNVRGAQFTRIQPAPDANLIDFYNASSLTALTLDIDIKNNTADPFDPAYIGATLHTDDNMYFDEILLSNGDLEISPDDSGKYYLTVLMENKDYQTIEQFDLDLSVYKEDGHPLEEATLKIPKE